MLVVLVANYRLDVDLGVLWMIRCLVAGFWEDEVCIYSSRSVVPWVPGSTASFHGRYPPWEVTSTTCQVYQQVFSEFVMGGCNTFVVTLLAGAFKGMRLRIKIVKIQRTCGSTAGTLEIALRADDKAK